MQASNAPRFRSVPAYSSSAGREAVDLAASAGLKLDDWQADVLEASLAERADGKWAASEVGVIVPRQNGKGAILEARELFGLFLGGEKLILHSAQDFKTAAEAFLRIRALVENTDDLRKRVKQIRTSHGDEGIELLNGARLRFVARSRSSGRGFSGDLVILDEAYALHDEAMAAMLPTLSARPNPQVWFTSSAPLTSSEVLRRLCVRGREGRADGLAYFEWCADEAAMSDDREAWTAANPGMGVRLSLEFTAKERDALAEAEFRRERMGIWQEVGRSSVIPDGYWDALRDPDSTRVGKVTFAVDVAPDRARASIAVVGAREDGRTHLELIDNRPEAWWLVDRIKDLSARHAARVVVDQRSAAGSFIEALRDAGVDVVVPESKDVAAAAGSFYDAVTPSVASVRHRGQPALDAAIAAAATRPMGDAWTWDRRKPSVDITPLVAVTLALWGHSQSGRPSESDFYMI